MARGWGLSPCRLQRHPNANTLLAMLLLTEHMPRKTSVCRKSDKRRLK
jgi:hypothetical protein